MVAHICGAASVPCHACGLRVNARASPTPASADEMLRIAPPGRTTLCVVLSPVGPYFPTGAMVAPPAVMPLVLTTHSMNTRCFGSRVQSAH
jgi:hypothetical protein